MNAIIYAWPMPEALEQQQAHATVRGLPIRTEYGLQETLPFEWPTGEETQPANKPLARVNDPSTKLFDPQPTSRQDLPSASQWSMRLVHALTEVLNGSRPVQQLTRWLTPEVLAHVQRNLLNRSMPRMMVRSIHVHETDDGVAEVSSVLGTNNRAFALAIRLEGLDGRWRATTLIVGL